MAHVGLVHHDPCRCKVKGFRVIFSIDRNVSKGCNKLERGGRESAIRRVVESHGWFTMFS